MPDTLAQQFKKKFETLAGHAHIVADVEAACDAIASIIAENDSEQICLSELPAEVAQGVESRCARAGIRVLKPPYNGAILPDEIDRCRVGISSAAFAIAENGAMAELALNDATRLVSSLPHTHVAVLRAADVVASLEEASPRIDQFFRENPRAACLTLLSGPSRSGDIEMTLTLGVHGPKVAHAVLIETMKETLPRS